MQPLDLVDTLVKLEAHWPLPDLADSLLYQLHIFAPQLAHHADKNSNFPL